MLGITKCSLAGFSGPFPTEGRAFTRRTRVAHYPGGVHVALPADGSLHDSLAGSPSASALSVPTRRSIVAGRLGRYWRPNQVERPFDYGRKRDGKNDGPGCYADQSRAVYGNCRVDHSQDGRPANKSEYEASDLLPGGTKQPKDHYEPGDIREGAHYRQRRHQPDRIQSESRAA